MSDPKSFGHYLAAWNERDPRRIRDYLSRSVTDDVLFVDPANRKVGLDQLEALIREAHELMPTATYHRVSGIDGRHDRYRYRWEVRRQGLPNIPGMDVSTLDASGPN